MAGNTIYALSTVFGKSGVAVFRISGKNATEAVRLMTNLDVGQIVPRQAYFAKIYDTRKKQLLDCGVVLYFKAPQSFTGEDIVEIQTHGSLAVLRSVLSSLAEIDDFRLAEPGEFTRRAFYQDKMDLTEAEGLADLIDAETAEQQKQALRQMSGDLKNLYDGWRQRLLEIYAYLEAFIDFPEEDIDPAVIKHHLESIATLTAEIKKHLKSAGAGERLREGFRVVIMGPTNAGKSSLINALVERQAAIVSDIPGTTRDAIDVHLDISGYPVIVTDKAGIRSSTDEIERQGIHIALEKSQQADMVLAIFDASKATKEVVDVSGLSLEQHVIYLANKADLLTDAKIKHLKSEGCLPICAKTRQGLPELLTAISDVIKETVGAHSGALMTRARYQEALKECLQNLEAFDFKKPIELGAEDIRLAARALGKITGRVEVDEILDKIFSSLCIGK
ncbi:MAG: tRNA uridine-5-carboxymethylaminomethyl(34) synthesis GTPase MnmE [Alphaproteobacteria bacterium]|nr:tRNA uridine-5-carboxymethylaminomethyl(34) synthesis GTPase MnmE [Alphaproteobacteria bacterium]